MIYVTHDQIEAMTMGDRICVMRDGVIMQVATPLELYNRPANLFVAGFIGSPPMNFLSGTVTATAGAAAVFVADGDVLTIALEGELARRAAPHAGRPVVLGFRPEHLTLAEGPGPVAVTLEADLVEPMGAETLLHLRAGGKILIARIKPMDRIARGDAVKIALDLAHAHLFDPVTEQVLR
jgi:multiple sugar transport system ATP-binding protein